MARKVSKETVQLWRERMARQAASGVSIRQFCDQERIPQATFYAWRRRFRERTTPPAKPVTRRRTRPGRDMAESRRTGDFIPLRLLDTPTAWEVVHPAAIVCESAAKSVRPLCSALWACSTGGRTNDRADATDPSVPLSSSN